MTSTHNLKTIKEDPIAVFASIIATRVNGAVITAIYCEFDKVVVPKYVVLVNNHHFSIQYIVDDLHVTSRPFDVLFDFTASTYNREIDEVCGEFEKQILEAYRAYHKEKPNES